MVFPSNWQELVHNIDEHNHSEQQVAPLAAAPVTITAGGGAWALGAFSNDIIAAGAEVYPFDLHWIDINGPSANADYVIELYWGAADTLACRCCFTRLNVTDRSFINPLQTRIIPAGSRIRGKLMASAGGSSCSVKIFYHHYR